MPWYRITTEARAVVEYEVVGESVEDVLMRWNAGGVSWEALVGFDQQANPTELLLSFDSFTCPLDIDESNVVELVKEPTDV